MRRAEGRNGGEVVMKRKQPRDVCLSRREAGTRRRRGGNEKGMDGGRYTDEMTEDGKERRQEREWKGGKEVQEEKAGECRKKKRMGRGEGS